MINSLKKSDFPEMLYGFEHIKRFYDKKNNALIAKILPGEYYVTKQNEIIATVLGSCVSVCIRDKKNGIGAMNHFMLPEAQGEKKSKWTASPVDQSARYGTYAMEHMINDLIKHGGKRNNFEIKMCGAGRIISSMADVGAKNIAFIKKFLHNEGYDVLSEDLGDIYPRKVRYCPMTGKLLIKKMESMHNDRVVAQEEKLKHQICTDSSSGGIELF